jgi:hypothetical protein
MEYNSNITSGTLTTGCSGTITTLGTGTNCITSSGTTIYGSLTLNNNTSSMNQQVKVAVFKVTRNKHNQIKSSVFISELWVEKKPGISLEYAVGKALKYQYEADEIVIKEVFTVTL